MLKIGRKKEKGNYRKGGEKRNQK